MIMAAHTGSAGTTHMAARHGETREPATVTVVTLVAAPAAGCRSGTEFRRAAAYAVSAASSQIHTENEFFWFDLSTRARQRWRPPAVPNCGTSPHLIFSSVDCL
jgi:hypothetical protein